ncbi:matrixin family metalloprotease [Nocardioides caeni]|nr:matrixin family metalloprotease [Nocardioides caeni]
MHERWVSGVVLLACIAGFIGVVLVGPTDEMAALRRVLGIGEDRLADPADVEPGGTYAFLQYQPGDEDDPVTWSPCRPIEFEINPDGAPQDDDGAVELVRDAVSDVASIAGLRFDYLGTTDRRPRWEDRFLPAGRREPVLIAWADAGEVPLLSGDVAGVGGAVAVRRGSVRGLHYVTGQVTLDSDAFDEIDLRVNGDAEQRAIILHELGHLLGLDHVDSEEELMYPDNLGRLEFGTGDLNGLVRLGQGEC